MVTLPDLMRAAYGGAAFDALAKQFGVAPGAAESALLAVSPAFAEAFSRAAASPMGMKAFYELLASHPATSFYDQMAASIPPEAQEKGREIMTKVFGSERVQKALAEQAAAQAGVSQAVMIEMMPLVANAVMDEMAKQIAANPLVAAWTQAWSPAPERKTPPEQPEGNPTAASMFEAGEAQMRAFADMVDSFWKRP